PVLNAAAQAAPDDDRIWLGWASLKARQGHFDDSLRWLDRCLDRRPLDPVVWRARLDWARAAEIESEVRRALGHLPPDQVPPTEVLALRAWFARRSGDSVRERRALEKLIELDPGALPAMETLAELLLRTGHPEEAKRLRQRRGELGRILDWYMFKIFPADRLEHARELARAAAAIGRRFEARCWWQLAAHRSPRRDLPRSGRARLAPGASAPPAF